MEVLWDRAEPAVVRDAALTRFAQWPTARSPPGCPG